MRSPPKAWNDYHLSPAFCIFPSRFAISILGCSVCRSRLCLSPSSAHVFVTHSCTRFLFLSFSFVEFIHLFILDLSVGLFSLLSFLFCISQVELCPQADSQGKTTRTVEAISTTTTAAASTAAATTTTTILFLTMIVNIINDNPHHIPLFKKKIWTRHNNTEHHHLRKSINSRYVRHHNHHSTHRHSPDSLQVLVTISWLHSRMLSGSLLFRLSQPQMTLTMTDSHPVSPFQRAPLPVPSCSSFSVSFFPRVSFFLVWLWLLLCFLAPSPADTFPPLLQSPINIRFRLPSSPLLPSASFSLCLCCISPSRPQALLVLFCLFFSLLCSSHPHPPLPLLLFFLSFVLHLQDKAWLLLSLVFSLLFLSCRWCSRAVSGFVFFLIAPFPPFPFVGLFSGLLSVCLPACLSGSLLHFWLTGWLWWWRSSLIDWLLRRSVFIRLPWVLVPAFIGFISCSSRLLSFFLPFSSCPLVCLIVMKKSVHLIVWMWPLPGLLSLFMCARLSAFWVLAGRLRPC